MVHATKTRAVTTELRISPLLLSEVGSFAAFIPIA
jgi:hypothetical protein